MKRTTIALPDDLATLVAREARRTSTSVSAVVRQALATRFDLSMRGRRRIPFASLGKSGRRHTARQMEEILAREWAPDRSR